MTRLGDFWMFLMTNFRSKVAQLFGDFLGFIEATFTSTFDKFGLLFTPTSGPTHTVCNRKHYSEQILLPVKVHWHQIWALFEPKEDRTLATSDECLSNDSLDWLPKSPKIQKFARTSFDSFGSIRYSLPSEQGLWTHKLSIIWWIHCHSAENFWWI